MDKTTFINEILAEMQSDLGQEQLMKLEAKLSIKLHNVRLEEECTALTLSERSWEKILAKFVGCKRLENCAESTLVGYLRFINNMRTTICKKIGDITTDDLRYYMAIYQYRHDNRVLSLSYMNDMRHCFSSFFGWAYQEGYIQSDPSKRLRKIKVPEKLVDVYSTLDRVKLIECSKTDRDIALQHCLYSSGARIGEMLQLNISDLEYIGRGAEAVVRHTKGKAERRLYFSEEAVFYLNRYLASRTDNNPALFVGLKAPHNRLTIGGAQTRISQIGKMAGVYAHPHKWRSSFATDMCKRNCPIEVVSKMLGHKKLETTSRYRSVGEDEARQAHAKYFAA